MVPKNEVGITDSIYGLVGGCPSCPYVEECVQISDLAGYTMDDEYGSCPDELVERYKKDKGVR